MGLTVSHGCFNAPYSSFHWWRCAIADAVGIPLEKMEGFCEPEDGDPIAWCTLQPDVLQILLRHSDFEGSIVTEDCGPLAARLEEILPLLSDNPEPTLNARIPTRQFIRGLRMAASSQQDVQFW